MDSGAMALRRVGIAGYMGSGKSTAAGMLAQRGAVIIDADREAKRLMAEESGLRRKILDTFGNSIAEGGGISFRALGTIVFSAKEELLQLNTLVHPPLIERLKGLLEKNGQANCILDAALIPL